MSYDAHSVQAKKGAIGEQIVKTILEDSGVCVSRPDNAAWDEPTLIDFHAVPIENELFSERLVEVKVRKAIPYAYGQYPCYAFPVVQLEAYQKYAEERKLPLELWIVDPENKDVINGFVDDATALGLNCKRFIGGKEFPFDQMTKRGEYRFFHRDQFHFALLSRDEALELFGDEFAAIEALDNKQAKIDNRRIFNSVTDGRGISVDDCTDEAVAAISALVDEFGEDKVRDAIGDFCRANFDKFCCAAIGDGVDYFSLENLTGALRDILTAEKPAIDTSKFSTDEKLPQVLLERFANVVGLSTNDLAAAVLEMRALRFEERQNQLKKLLGV